MKLGRESASAQADEAPFEGDHRRLGAVADPELLEHVFHVGLHCLVAHVQVGGDLLVRAAGAQISPNPRVSVEAAGLNP